MFTDLIQFVQALSERTPDLPEPLWLLLWGATLIGAGQRSRAARAGSSERSIIKPAGAATVSEDDRLAPVQATSIV